MITLARPIAYLLALLLAAGCTSTSAQQLALVVDGLDRPLGVTNAGDGSNRLFVIEQAGTVRVVQDGSLSTNPFLDIRDRVTAGGERGLLGLAFPPDFATSATFYAAYSDQDGATVVSRFAVDGTAGVADADSEQVVLRQPQPYANHNGGHVAFGPDGYLYIGLGDGGSGGDPLGSGQDLQTWLGTILRIDVGDADTYRVPGDNPFVDLADALPEIWAYGLRNPWRFSFDRDTGDLWIGDVGQNAYEEIDHEPTMSPGAVNYGWNAMEGPVCFRTQTCDQTGLELPIVSYSHDSGWGRSVTGGFVYRGSDVPGMIGTYVFGDFVSGRVFQAVLTDTGTWAAKELLATGRGVASFGEDEDGELYLVDLRGGALYRFAPQ